MSQNIQLKDVWFQRFYQDFFNVLRICNVQSSGQSHDCLFFRINVETIHDPKQIVHTATRIAQLLAQWEQFIEGYTAIFDYNVDENYNPYLDHINIIVRNKKKNSTLVTHTIALMVQVSIKDSQENFHTLEEIQASIQQTPVESYIAKESLVQNTKRVLLAWISSDQAQRNVGILYGAKDDGMDIVVHKTLSLIPCVYSVQLNRQAETDHLSTLRQFTEQLYRFAHQKDHDSPAGTEQLLVEDIDMSKGGTVSAIEHEESAVKLQKTIDPVIFQLAENVYESLCAIARKSIYLIQENNESGFFVCQVFGVYEWSAAVEKEFFAFLDVIDPAQYIHVIKHTSVQQKGCSSYLYLRWYHFEPYTIGQKGSELTPRKRDDQHLVYYYLRRRFQQFGWIAEKTKSIPNTRALLTHMPKRFLRVLFIVRMLGLHAVHDRILPVLEKEHVAQVQMLSLLRVLNETGILFLDDFAVHTVRFFSLADIEYALGKQGASLRRRVAQSFMDSIQDASYIDGQGYRLGYWRFLSAEQREQLFLFIGTSMVECRRDPQKLFAVIDSAKQVDGYSSAVLSLIQTIITVEHKLSQRQAVSLFAIQDQLGQKTDTMSSELDLARLLVLAKLYLHEGDTVHTIVHVKQILSVTQKDRSPWDDRCIAGAHLLLGRIAILKKRYKEAESYFQYALDILHDTSFFASYAYACQCRCMVSFHLGSLQDGCNLAKSLSQRAVDVLQHQWALYAQFFHARFLFELGHYQRAQNVLEETYEVLRVYYDDEVQQLFSKWIARCLIYRGSLNEGIDILLAMKASKERSLFLSEAYVMTKQYDDALFWIQEVVDNFEYIEDPGLLAYPMHGELLLEYVIPEYSSAYPVYIKMFHAMLLGLAGSTEASYEIISGVSKRYSFELTQSPYASLSSFFGAEALFAIGSSGSEGKSLLSKAITAFKERLSQLYQSEARISLASNHYWYAMLQKRAHEFYIS